jgi:hypothetical protein
MGLWWGAGAACLSISRVLEAHVDPMRWDVPAAKECVCAVNGSQSGMSGENRALSVLDWGKLLSQNLL